MLFLLEIFCFLTLDIYNFTANNGIYKYNSHPKYEFVLYRLQMMLQ